MSSKKANQEKVHKLAELISYYEVANKAEGKSPKTYNWYSQNLKRFRSYVLSRHRNENINSIDVKLLREYILHLMTKHRFENHPNNPATSELYLPRRFMGMSEHCGHSLTGFREKI